MKRVRVSMTILDTIDFKNNVTQDDIDEYIDAMQERVQKALDRCKFGVINNVEYNLEEGEDEDC